MNNHVTSLETSKKLMEAGVMKISIFYHVFNQPSVNGRPPIMTRKEIDDLLPFSTEVEYIPAYLLSELLEMVEGTIDIQFNKGRTAITIFGKNDDGVPTITNMAYESVIQTVAEAILWQKETK